MRRLLYPPKPLSRLAKRRLTAAEANGTHEERKSEAVVTNADLSELAMTEHRSKELPPTSRWLSVAEMLPDEGNVNVVLALLVDAASEDLRLFICDADFVRANANNFTHWLPIPPLPSN